MKQVIWSYWGFLKKVCSYISHVLDPSCASKSSKYEKKRAKPFVLLLQQNNGLREHPCNVGEVIFTTIVLFHLSVAYKRSIYLVCGYSLVHDLNVYSIMISFGDPTGFSQFPFQNSVRSLRFSESLSSFFWYLRINHDCSSTLCSSYSLQNLFLPQEM